MKKNENSIPKYHHIHTLITAFSYGVLTADSYHENYKIPPNFEDVMNHMSASLRKEFKNKIVVKVSLNSINKIYRKIAFKNKNFKQWNESKNGNSIVFSTRYSPTPKERDFIDLDAVFQNTSYFLKQKIKNDEDRDLCISDNWKKNKSGKKI